MFLPRQRGGATRQRGTLGKDAGQRDDSAKGSSVRSPIIARLARTTHAVSAFWVLILAAIIFGDVMGRYLLSQPLLGATEIIANSVVSITFLQLPLAIYQGGMIRSTLLYDALGESAQRLLRTLAGVLGLAFFLGTAYSAWGPALEALAVSEYEGEGALRSPPLPAIPTPLRARRTKQ